MIYEYTVHIPAFITALADPRRAQEAMHNMMDAVGVEMVKAIANNTPRKSGFLADQWDFYMEGLDVIITNSARYAEFVEEDTEAHVIAASAGTVLRWYGAYSDSGIGAEGTESYAPYVNHPGTTGQHMVKNAIAENFQDACDHAAAAMREYYKI